VWLGKAAVHRNPFAFLSEIDFQVKAASKPMLFAVGRVLKGNDNAEEATVFGQKRPSLATANRALLFYNFQIQSYRNAVDSWTLVGLRNRVVKDIRKMIAMMIWDWREEAEYSLEKKKSNVVKKRSRK
jgi:hypothetical protein